MRSLARFSKRMMPGALCIPTSYYNYLISNSISLPYSGIFSTFSRDTLLYRSWWVFSFGGLWPPSSDPDITQPYSGNNFNLDILNYVTITHFVKLSNLLILIFLRYLLTIPKPYNQGIFQYPVQFELFRFHSPLLTESQLISFPPLNKMFQFRGFPLKLFFKF